MIASMKRIKENSLAPVLKKYKEVCEKAPVPRKDMKVDNKSLVGRNYIHCEMAVKQT